LRLEIGAYGMFIERCKILFNRGKGIYDREGTASFIKQAFLFMVKSSVYFFVDYHKYYIYEKRLNETNEFEFEPKIQNIILKIICTSEEVDELILKGFDLCSYYNTKVLKKRLNEKAVLFCVFIGKELCHASWVAMSIKAKSDSFSICIDFQNEAYIENCFTNPKYRGLGLYPFTLCKIIKFLRVKNKSNVKIGVQKSNFSSIKGISKAKFIAYGEVRCLKLLFWRFWKEKPLSRKSKEF